jgi:hypothetical protein
METYDFLMAIVWYIAMVFGFCVLAGVLTAMLFGKVVKKLEQEGYEINDGQIFNPESNEWEDL